MGHPYGLEAGRIRLKDNENFEVRKSNAPQDIDLLEEQFDIALVLKLSNTWSRPPWSITSPRWLESARKTAFC